MEKEQFTQFRPLLEQQVDDLLDFGDLDDWESDFVNSMHEQLAGDTVLSDKQIQKLHEVWRRHKR